MLAIIALVLFLLSWFLHGAQVANLPAWIDWQGLAILGLAAVAAHLMWPTWRRPVP
jgi:hypothetical protein